MLRYPPVGFFFNVVFTESFETDNQQIANTEAQFQSVTGLSVDMQTETVKEGGENSFEHVLPVRTKFSPLVLKRGLVKNSKMGKWLADAMLNFDIRPMDLLVNLLHFDKAAAPGSADAANPQPLMTWVVVNAWPKKWSVSEFNAEQNSLAIESMELHYSYFYEQRD